MAERQDERLLRLFDRAEGRITRIITLAGAIAALCVAVISLVPYLKLIALPIGGIAFITLFLILVHVNRRKRRSDLAPYLPTYVYNKRQRLAALGGMVSMLIVAGVLAYGLIPSKPPPLQCTPVIVTVTTFSKGEDRFAQSIQTDLLGFLEKQKQLRGKLEPKRHDVVVKEDTEAKTFGRSLEGNSHLVIWGEIANPDSIWANVTIAQKCELTGREVQNAMASPADSTNDRFRFHLGLEGTTGSQHIGKELSDFAQFVTGVALYEQGEFEEAIEVFKSVQMRFARFFEGLARLDLSRRTDAIGNLKGSIKAYGEFVGPGWTFQEDQDEILSQDYKAMAVAACINASNAYVELSDFEFGGHVVNAAEAGLRAQNAKDHLDRAFNGYLRAIALYDELGLVKKDETTQRSNLRIAEFDLAVTKAKFAAISNQDLKVRWLQDAEKDLNDILVRLGEEQDYKSEHYQRAKASLGALCIELSRVEPDRKGRLNQAIGALSEALDLLDNQDSYDRAILQANLGTAFIELAVDEPVANLALDHLKGAEDQYENANKHFSKNTASADFADNLSDLGLVFVERARWSENGEAERLLSKAQENQVKALEICCSDANTLKSALLSNRLARTKREMGRRLGSIELLQSSIDICERSLRILQLAPHRAIAQRNLGDSYYELGVAAEKINRVHQATTAYRNSTVAYAEALRVWTQDNAYYDWLDTRKGLDNAKARLSTFGLQHHN